MTTDYLADLMLCELDVLMVLEVFNRTFGKREKHAKAVCAVMAGGVFGCVSFGYLCGNPAVSLFVLALCLCVLPLYPGTFQKKMLFAVGLISLNISVVLILNDITNILPKARYIYGYAACHVLFWINLYLLMKAAEHADSELNGKIWALLYAVPAVCIVSVPFLIWLAGNYSGSVRQASMYHLPIQTAFLMLDLMAFVFYAEFAKYYRQAGEKALLSQQMEYQREHYQKLKDAYDTMRELRHDMKNQLRTAAYLFENGSDAALSEYLETSEAKIRDAEQIIYTGNMEIDALLNIKLEEMKRSEIQCSTDILIPADLEFPLEDMVILIGNIFDNAAEACEKIRSDQRKVNFSMQYRDKTLWIHMDNPCGTFSEVTEKREKALHGLGLENIKRTAKRYGGFASYEVENGTFNIDITLHMQKMANGF